MFERLKRYVRSKTVPIPYNVAMGWKINLSIVYAFIAWNVIGFTIYTFIKSNMDETNPNTIHEYAKVLGIRNATIVKYNNFTKVEEDVLDFEKLEEQKSLIEPSTGYWNRRLEQRLAQEAKNQNQ